MTDRYGNGISSPDERASALDVGLRPEVERMTREEAHLVEEAGHELAQYAGGTWLLIRSEFVSDNKKKGTEGHLREMLRGAFGYPTPDEEKSGLTLNVLLDSPGGSLDSAYSSALYLAEYSNDVRVFVPGRAKSASTLVALGADTLYMSAFGELGPLDTQIADPRNPANHMSALDCYQSVDYVRDFGIRTLKLLLPELVRQTEGKIPVSGLLSIASEYTQGIVRPMMESISALDFGGWGRSLRIGEQYARRLLRMHSQDVDDKRIDDIAEQLVFRYTHHLFPIDFHEAIRIHLQPVEVMEPGLYDRSMAVIEHCHGKDFIGFLSKDEAKKVQPWYRGLDEDENEPSAQDAGARDPSRRPQAHIPT